MNIKGNARGGPRALTKHLFKDENETVRVIGSRGVAAHDVEGALLEMDALGADLRTGKTLYHGIISPAQGEDFAMSEADWELARNAWLKGMGFENQPYLEVEHEKFGKEDGILRRHRHIIVPTADASADYTKAIHTGHNYRKHEEIARTCERQLGHEHVQGAHVDRFGNKRPPRTPTVAEQRAAERGSVTAKEAKALGAEIWRAADSGKAINAALSAQGWQLARGDKQRAGGGAYFMAIDPAGEAHELRRMMPVNAAEVYSRLGDLDPSQLPTVKEAKAIQRERQSARTMREARDAAKGRVDDVRPAASQERRLSDQERRGWLRGVWQHQAEEVATRRDSDATLNMPPKVQPKFTREAVQRREATAAPVPPRQSFTRTTQAQRAPQREFGKVERATEKAAGKGAGILARGILSVLAGLLKMFDLFPAKPPSPEQQKRNYYAAKEQEAADDKAAAKAALVRDLLERSNRDSQERERQRRERGGYDDDYGRGREP